MSYYKVLIPFLLFMTTASFAGNTTKQEILAKSTQQWSTTKAKNGNTYYYVDIRAPLLSPHKWITIVQVTQDAVSQSARIREERSGTGKRCTDTSFNGTKSTMDELYAQCHNLLATDGKAGNGFVMGADALYNDNGLLKACRSFYKKGGPSDYPGEGFHLSTLQFANYNFANLPAACPQSID